VLRELNPATGTYEGLLTTTTTGAGADDLIFVDNEYGEWGILVVCGVNGADTHYYTEIDGVGEWRADPGNSNIGNTEHAEAHCGGDYGLVVSFSGCAIAQGVGDGQHLGG